MPPLLEESTGSCSACQKPATKICSGCMETPSLDGNIESVFYCSVTCQKAHWPIHKDDCRSRKYRLIIFRMGSTLQMIFYVFRENLFCSPVLKVEKKDGNLLVYEGSQSQPRTAYDLLQPFPAGSIDSGNDKLSILSHLSCKDAIGWMHDVIRHFLSNVAVEVQEYAVNAKGTRGSVITVNEFGVKQIAKQDFNHLILRVVMKDNSSYALDLTCAQYGYFEPVINWDEYLNTRVDEFFHIGGLGNNFGRVRDLMLCFAGPNYESITENVFYNNQKASLTLLEGVKSWEYTRDVKFQDVCILPEAEFAAKQENLVVMLDHDLLLLLEHLQAEHEKALNQVSS